MVDCTPNNLNRLMEEENNSPSFSIEPKTKSPKDKHRKIKKQGVDALKRFFQILTGIQFPETRCSWKEVKLIVWSMIFEARELEQQLKASILLDECTAKTWQIVHCARDALKKVLNEMEKLETSWVKPMQQIFVNPDDQGSKEGLQLHCAINFVRAKNDFVTSELDYKLARLIHEGSAEIQKLLPVDLKFSMLQDVKVPNHCSVESQISDPNNNPQEIELKTKDSLHCMRRTQGVIALKVFFYMYTGIVLPQEWEKIEELVKEQSNSAEKEEEKLKAMSEPQEVIKLEQAIKCIWDAFQMAKLKVNTSKAWILEIPKWFERLVSPDCYKQHGSSRLVSPVVDSQALELDSLIGSSQNGESSGNQLWDEVVLGDLENLLESAQRPESSKATGCRSEANSHVAPVAVGNMSSVGKIMAFAQACSYNECLLKEIMELFPEITGGYFQDLLAEGVRDPQQGLKLKDSNQELGSMDLRVLMLKQKKDKTESMVLGQNKQKLNQPRKMQKLKRKLSDCDF